MRGLAVGRLTGALVGLLVVAACAPAPIPPTIAEVLDGAAFAVRRDAATQRVHSLMESILPDSALGNLGVEKAGSWVGSSCGEGQNNWKVHDGYRLDCDVSETAYFAWDGKFEAGQVGIQQLVADLCPWGTLGPVKPRRRPLPYTFDSGASYTCNKIDTVAMGWADLKTLEYNDANFGRACESITNVRCGPGTALSDIRRILVKHDWAVRVRVFETYYKDYPD